MMVVAFVDGLFPVIFVVGFGVLELIEHHLCREKV